MCEKLSLPVKSTAALTISTEIFKERDVIFKDNLSFLPVVTRDLSLMVLEIVPMKK